MNPNVKLTEKLAVLATLNPASVAASTVLTSYVPIAKWGSLVALIQTGVLGTAATLDAKLVQATDSSGTGVKDVTGKAITQIVKASGDNVQAMIEMREQDIDSSNGFTHVALSTTVGTAASIYGAALIGGNPHYAPASAYNQAGVKQVV